MDFVNDRGLFHLLDEPERALYSAELFRVLKPGGRILITGAGGEPAKGRFNPVSEKAVDRFFAPPGFKRGPVLAVPLCSAAGVMEGRVAVVQKTGQARSA